MNKIGERKLISQYFFVKQTNVRNSNLVEKITAILSKLSNKYLKK